MSVQGIQLCARQQGAHWAPSSVRGVRLCGQLGSLGASRSHGTAKGRFPSLRFGTKTPGEDQLSGRWWCYIGWGRQKKKKKKKGREKMAFTAEGREVWKLSTAKRLDPKVVSEGGKESIMKTAGCQVGLNRW